MLGVGVRRPQGDWQCPYVSGRVRSTLPVEDEFQEKPSHTTIMVTINPSDYTVIDVGAILSLDISAVRFGINDSEKDIVQRLKIIAVALHNNRQDWPVARCIDIVNTSIMTGYVDSNPTCVESRHESGLIEKQFELVKNSTVEVTSSVDYYKHCNAERICIDDPYTLQDIKVGAEITIGNNKVVLECIEVLDGKTIKCKVIEGGLLGNAERVFIRGYLLKKPPITEIDKNRIRFAIKHKFDVLIINSVRFPRTIERVKGLFHGKNNPLVMATICEQQGLDDIDNIIKVSDGIILARDALHYQIENVYKLPIIQRIVGAKCKLAGKPFFISGGILREELVNGYINDCETSDATNAILLNNSLVLERYSRVQNLIATVNQLCAMCRLLRPFKPCNSYKLLSKFHLPVNAADACVLTCAYTVRATDIPVVIVITASGWTVHKLMQCDTHAIILAVCTSARVARRLQIYKGVTSAIYSHRPKKNWADEMKARVDFGLTCLSRRNLLLRNSKYAVLQHVSQASSFCDHFSVWRAVIHTATN